MARFDPHDPPVALLDFVAEHHLATLTTLCDDGSPHVVPVGFTFDQERVLVRVITFAGSRKARNLRAQPQSRAAVCQVDRGRWLTFEGPAIVRSDAESNAEGVRRYADRYRIPKDRSDRVTIEITVDTIRGRI